MKKIDVLQNVTVEILNYCNSSCIHCYLSHLSPKIVKFEDVISVIDQAAEAGAMQITLTGGEPLLHPNITEIIMHIKNKGMAVNLLTSLNVDITKCLDIVTVCDKIGISIYGSNKDIHDQITRIKGSFDAMLTNLRHFLHKNSSITLNITIIKENIGDAKNIVAFAKELNIQYRINYFLHGSSAKQHQVDINDIDLLKNLFTFREDASLMEINFMCIAGSASLWVDVDLDVYPCVFFRMRLGNLYNQKLIDIWKRSYEVKMLKTIDNQSFKKCRRCRLKNICSPCIGENYNANADITIPCEFSCRIGEYEDHLLRC